MPDEQVEETVRTFAFSDLLVRLDDPTVPARFSPEATSRHGGEGNFVVKPHFMPFVGQIRSRISDDFNRAKGIVQLLGRRFRYNIINADGGETWAAVRCLPLDLPLIDRLGIDPELVGILKGLKRRKGLVLVSGSTGDGKTTTVVGLLHHLLNEEGGFLFTCEDPPEFAMQGALGNGFVLQTEVGPAKATWADALETAMRSNPRWLMFGEIRSSEAAEALLQASGHFTIATTHASSVSDAIAATMQKAGSRLGESAKGKLADGLVAVLHQTLTPRGPRIELLMPESETNSDDPVRRMIRSGEYSKLKSQRTFEPTGR
jgi:twitching motility protein PilT